MCACQLAIFFSLLMKVNSWDYWVEQALSKLDSLKLLRSLRPICLPTYPPKPGHHVPKITFNPDDFEVFHELQQWDRLSVELQIAETTFQKWAQDIHSCGKMLWIHVWEVMGDGAVCKDGMVDNEVGFSTQEFKKLLLFSGNDYLGLSSHPTIRKAAAKTAQELGMGPRGSALICGYTNYHWLLESSLADLKNKEDCLLCPTGFAANMAMMVAIGNVGSLLAEGKKPLDDERIAIFSDSLNHASIIDGIRLAERQKSVKVFIYRHCDMSHLNALLSSCTMKKKVVVTDSLFSMDGDFAPMVELMKLRKMHGFLLVIDDAHGTFVCGKNGGGVAEMFGCERDVDICIGTLSKAAGCLGGFIACSKRWKQLILSRGRSFIFSTATPIPIAAAAYAAVVVAKKETWRRKAIWNRVQDFHRLTGIPVTSPIISLVVGSEEKALLTSRHLLKSGFHVIAVRPPTVPHNSCRLRVTLSAAHTTDDLKKFATALSHCMDLRDIGINSSNRYAKL